MTKLDELNNLIIKEYKELAETYADYVNVLKEENAQLQELLSRALEPESGEYTPPKSENERKEK
jgi:hypothetical protein